MSSVILIADDSREVCSALTKLMRASGHRTLTAENGRQALEIISSRQVDLLLLDLVMPEMDGFEVIETLRRRGNRTPILVISGEMDEYDIVYALGLGADDCVNKPFVPIVLNAKVNAILRRSAPDSASAGGTVCCPPFELNMKTRRFSRDGEDIELSEKEFDLMSFFMQHPNRVCLPEQLCSQVWDDGLSNRNTLMVHIHNLRVKVEKDPKNPVYIQTVRGSGYRFMPGAR